MPTSHDILTNHNRKKAKRTVKISVEVEEQRLTDLLTSALEGGSNYWYLIFDRHNPGVERISEIPMAGGWLAFQTAEYDEIGGNAHWTLDRAQMELGLQTVATKYPKHFADFLSENDNATTGDVFLQCCLFGELVFG